jgi:hypothetical protein
MSQTKQIVIVIAILSLLFFAAGVYDNMGVDNKPTYETMYLEKCMAIRAPAEHPQIKNADQYARALLAYTGLLPQEPTPTTATCTPGEEHAMNHSARVLYMLGQEQVQVRVVNKSMSKYISTRPTHSSDWLLDKLIPTILVNKEGQLVTVATLRAELKQVQADGDEAAVYIIANSDRYGEFSNVASLVAVAVETDKQLEIVNSQLQVKASPYRASLTNIHEPTTSVVSEYIAPTPRKSLKANSSVTDALQTMEMDVTLLPNVPKGMFSSAVVEELQAIYAKSPDIAQLCYNVLATDSAADVTVVSRKSTGPTANDYTEEKQVKTVVLSNFTGEERSQALLTAVNKAMTSAKQQYKPAYWDVRVGEIEYDKEGVHLALLYSYEVNIDLSNTEYPILEVLGAP